MKAKANAKINLFLNVVSKREDGYHELNMVTHPLELSDEISIDFSDHDIMEGMESKDNIIWKTVNIIRNLFDINQPLKINIVKNIPIGGGLGGGSADAAATLKIMNAIFELDLSDDKLAKIGVSIGADVPMCIYNQPAIVSGIGEKVQFITAMKSHVILVVPDVQVSTMKIFERTTVLTMSYKSSSNLVAALIKRDLFNVELNLSNDLFHITTQLYDECKKTISILKKAGLKFHMTGSGAVFYALYNNIEERDEIASSIEEMGMKIIKTQLLV